MKITRRFHISFILAVSVLFGGNVVSQSMPTNGLKDYYHDYFPIGVAVSARDLKDTAQVKLILSQFNSLTPENAMKWRQIHPSENVYNWADADSIVAFAQAHGLRVRGHNLCWHENNPDWLFKGADGKQVTKEVLLARLKAHIDAVVGRYKGKVYGWDVVNEAIDDDSAKFLRNSLWYQICGEDFIIKAFEYTHEADPNAVLFYNDYNTERPQKRERIYRLLKMLKEAHVPINAVGLQGHWSIYEPDQRDLIAAIKEFSSLGLKVQVTEMDISVYPWEKFNRKKRADENDSFSPELEQKQADKYAELFKIFRKYKSDISGVTFWNISDKHTWLDDYPVPGRKNYPLLFDQNLQPKKAYFSVVDF